VKTIPSLATYSLLGRSGLRVSPLALGTMTFGTEWGWGSPKETVFALLDRYLEAGGNLLDTADGYTNGTSERLIGEYFAARGGRDRSVIATKFTFSGDPGDPNAGGNGRKNIHRALEGSLKRLRTDYGRPLLAACLGRPHAGRGGDGDARRPGARGQGALSGAVGRAGLVSRPRADAGGMARVGAAGRTAAGVLAGRAQHRARARAGRPGAGLGITPWSPLASGLLSGKYTRAGMQAQGQGRLPTVAASGHPAFEKLLTERNWTIVDTLVRVAKEIGAPPAQVALAWVTRRPGVASTIMGATRIEQLESNLAALDLAIPAALLAQLDEVSSPPLVHPYHFFLTPVIRGRISGGTTVQAEPAGYRPKT